MIKSQTWRTNNFLVCDKVWRMAFAGLEICVLLSGKDMLLGTAPEQIAQLPSVV